MAYLVTYQIFKEWKFIKDWLERAFPFILLKKSPNRRKNEALFCVLSDFFEGGRYFIPLIFKPILTIRENYKGYYEKKAVSSVVEH